MCSNSHRPRSRLIPFSLFRDRSGVKVDIVIERRDGRVLAVEVIGEIGQPSDTRGLAFVRDRLGDRFECGVLLHSRLEVRLREP